MHDPPEKEALLQAVAEFLMNDVRPAFVEARLNFRTLIAANLLHQIGAELGTEEAQDIAELARLRLLLPDAEVSDAEVRERTARRLAIERLNRALAHTLRSGALDAETEGVVRRALLDTLRDKLAVNNPLFDARLEAGEET